MNLNFPLEGDNRAGVKIFYFTPVENVLSETDDDVTLHPNKVWYTGKATRFTLNFNERLRRGRYGTVSTISLNGFIPKRSYALDQVLKSMIGRDFILIVEDLNGKKLIVGTKDQPLTFELSALSGSRPGGNSGVEFSFSGNATELSRRPFSEQVPGGVDESEANPLEDWRALLKEMITEEMKKVTVSTLPPSGVPADDEEWVVYNA